MTHNFLKLLSSTIWIATCVYMHDVIVVENMSVAFLVVFYKWFLSCHVIFVAFVIKYLYFLYDTQCCMCIRVNHAMLNCTSFGNVTRGWAAPWGGS
jgi:hypothetical protein